MNKETLIAIGVFALYAAFAVYQITVFSVPYKIGLNF